MNVFHAPIMISRLLVLLASIEPLGAATGSALEFHQLQRTQRSAADLIRAGTPAQAVAHLRQNLRAEPGPGGEASALPQALLELAADFFNRREIAPARQALEQARTLAGPVLAGTTGATPQRRAQLYSSFGLLYEAILFDPANALACYEAALSLHPAEPLSRNRRLGLIEKQRRRMGGSR
ncbi:MAG TPA: hypothetical protein DIT64_06605 [Verrucomicrobiales bacterium]|nr:hypothetical protein [Verrucomicrobiales bacterium]